MEKALLHKALVLVLFFCTTINAYWWRFNNFTTKTLLLKVKLLGSNNPYYAIVDPNASTLFDWSPPNPMAGFCFDILQWIEVPSEILNDNSMVDKSHKVINNKKINNLFFGNKPLFKLKNAAIQYFSSEIYKKTIRFARYLAGKKIINWASKQHVRSACRSRHIIIVEDINGDIKFFTQKS
jgi:hypothetical protein